MSDELKEIERELCEIVGSASGTAEISTGVIEFQTRPPYWHVFLTSQTVPLFAVAASRSAVEETWRAYWSDPTEATDPLPSLPEASIVGGKDLVAWISSESRRPIALEVYAHPKTGRILRWSYRIDGLDGRTVVREHSTAPGRVDGLFRRGRDLSPRREVSNLLHGFELPGELGEILLLVRPRFRPFL